MYFLGSSNTLQSAEETADGDDDGESSSNEDDIEAQIRREVEGLKPGKGKPRKFQAIRMEVPCGMLLVLQHHIQEQC